MGCCGVGLGSLRGGEGAWFGRRPTRRKASGGGEQRGEGGVGGADGDVRQGRWRAGNSHLLVRNGVGGES